MPCVQWMRWRTARLEGLIQLDERKLTVGGTAKVTADITTCDVVVYGYVKGNVKMARTSRDRLRSTGARRGKPSPRGQRLRRLARGRKAFNGPACRARSGNWHVRLGQSAGFKFGCNGRYEG